MISTSESSSDSRVWDLVVKTCDRPDSGTDAGVYLKVFYENNADSESFYLDNPARYSLDWILYRTLSPH